MAEQDRRADIRALIDTLRRVTAAVQVFPFIYTGLYIAALAFYNFVSEGVQSALDSLFYVSPVCVVSFLLLSKLLRLCKWHKTACVLPIVPQVVSAIDSHVVMFPASAVYVFTYSVIFMSVMLLISAYNVFMK